MNIAILLVTLVGAQKINPNGPTVVSDFVNCLNNLIETNFDKPGLVIFSHSFNTSSLAMRIAADVLKKIHNSNRYTVEVSGPDSQRICSDNTRTEIDVLHMDTFKIMSIASYFVIVVDNYDDFTYLASKFTRSRFWNPHAKFIVLLYYKVKNDYEIQRVVENMLTCLYKYNVINIIIIVPKAEAQRSALIYSWKPYDPPNYCGYHNESAKNRLIIENVCDKGMVKNKGNVFKDKLPSNMHGCKIYILAIERQPFVSRHKSDPNIEKQFIKEMLKELNFSISFEIIHTFRGERDEKGIWSGALKELVARRGDVLLGGIFPDFDVHEDFECSSTYLADSYTWVVPRAPSSPLWNSLTAAFDRTVWCLATVVFFICVFTWKLLGLGSGDTMYNSMFNHCFLNTWILMLGFPAYMLPKKQSLRIFFGILNMYCILLMTAYQTKLIDILRNPTFGHQINSIQGMVRSGLKYGGTEELHGLFYNSTDRFDSLIGENWINVNNMSKALLDVVVYRNFSVLCSRLQLAHLSTVLPELRDSLGRRKYIAFKQNTFFVSLEIIGLKGFPFMEKISNILNVHKQIGMNEVIYRHFVKLYRKKRETLLRSLNVRRNYVSPLSVQHLQSGFLVLGLGMFGGTIIFIIELIIELFSIRHVSYDLFRKKN